MVRIAAAALFLLGLLCADYELLDDEKVRIDAVTLSIDTVTDSSVTLRWTRYNDDDFSNYVVLYGTGDIVDWNDKVADSLMFDFDTTKIVQPLDDRSHYYFRVMVLNSDGVFSGSNTVDTTTPENMHGKIRLETPTEATDDKTVLHWSSSIDTFDRYMIYADTTRTVDTTDTLLSTVYSDTSEVIDNTVFGRSFWVRVFAYDDTAVVAKSSSVEVRKQER